MSWHDKRTNEEARYPINLVFDDIPPEVLAKPPKRSKPKEPKPKPKPRKDRRRAQTLDEMDDHGIDRVKEAIQKKQSKPDKEIRRSRFWGDIASEQKDIRLAALVFAVAAKTAYQYKHQGKRGHRACWPTTMEELGKQIGLKDRTWVWRLLQKARRRRLVQYQKTRRGVILRLKKTVLYRRFIDDGRKLSAEDVGGRHPLFYYYHELVDEVGMVSAFLFGWIRHYSGSVDQMGRQGTRSNAEGWLRRYPFLTLGQVKKAIYMLRKKKLVVWENDDTGVPIYRVPGTDA